jgi:DNA mismatch endonuclease, patch repair protein
MRGNRSVDTRPELRLRSALHRRGLRFRKNLLIRTEGRSARADIVFPRKRVAVFVDGCFWHACPEHGHIPRSNRPYWEQKLARNAERDTAVNAALESERWKVLRIWEHVETDQAADQIAAALMARDDRG